MKYAVIKTGGKQYRVVVGETLSVELLAGKGQVEFSEVLLVVDGDKVEIGAPTLEGVSVYGEIIGDVKGDKIEVFKYKSKSRYRKHTGHRQGYTQVKILSIGEKPVAVKAEKVESPKVAAKKPASTKSSLGGPAVKKAVAKKVVK